MALVVSGVLFGVGAVLTWRRLPVDINTISWVPLVVAAVVGVPAMILLNAIEYRAIGQRVGHGVPLREALRIVVIGSAANLAPFPGSVLVRSSDLNRRGALWKAAIGSQALAAGVWVGLSGLALAVASLGMSPALIWVGVGIALLSVLSVVSVWWRSKDATALSMLVLVEGGTILATAGRIFLILLALGLAFDWRATLAIASTYALASVIAVVPAGLGIRELLSGLVAATLFGEGSAGFAVSAIDRVIGMLVHIPIAIWLSRGSKQDLNGELE